MKPPPPWLLAYPEAYRPFVHPSLPLPWYQIFKTVVLGLTLLPIRALVFGISLALFGAVTRAVLLGWPSPDVPLRGWRRTVFRGSGRILSRLVLFSMGFYWISKRGSRDPAAAAIVCNHLSYLDILYHMQDCMPAFVAKEYVRRLPFIGHIARVMQCIFVAPRRRTASPPSPAELSPGPALSSAARLLVERMGGVDRGIPLLVYPEGTTTNGFYITRFHQGAFLAGQPVQPCVLVHSWRWFCPSWESVPFQMHLVCQFTQLWQHVTLTYLPTMRAPCADRTHDQLPDRHLDRVASEQEVTPPPSPALGADGGAAAEQPSAGDSGVALEPPETAPAPAAALHDEVFGDVRLPHPVEPQRESRAVDQAAAVTCLEDGPSQPCAEAAAEAGRERVCEAPDRPPALPSEHSAAMDFARAVRNAMCAASGLLASDAYARHKFELHRHIRSGALDWRWWRNGSVVAPTLPWYACCRHRDPTAVRVGVEDQLRARRVIGEGANGASARVTAVAPWE